MWQNIFIQDWTNYPPQRVPISWYIYTPHKKIIPPLFFMSFMMCISSKLAIIFYYYVILYSFLRKNKRLHLDDNKKCFSHFPDNNVMIWRYQLLYVKPLRTKKQMNNDADKHIISYVQLSCINQVEENYTLPFLFELVM